jgi:hypothetical protein
MFECRRSFTLHLSHLHLSHPRHWPQKRTVAVPERVPTNLLCNTCPNRCRFHKVLYGLAKTQSASAGYATRSRCSLKTVSTSGASGIGFLLASVFIADPLPRWTFFSMVPESDFCILYRDRITGGPLTPWRLIALPRRRISRIVWNPGRRQRKAVEDLCVGFVTHFARRLNESEQSSPWSYWYLALVYYVAQVPPWPLGEARQFMISKTLGMQEKPPEILFISPFFQLSRAALAEVTDVVVEQGSHGTDVTACAHPCHS